MDEQPLSQNETGIQPTRASLSPLTTTIGSGFFSGYAPFASGTVGSVVGLLFFLIPHFSNPVILIPATIILFIVGGIAAGKMETVYGNDPGVVTVDEIVGLWISLLFITVIPLWDKKHLLILAFAFFVFRILDILKPYPANTFDKKSGGWNIMLDDVVAAIYTNIIIQIGIRFFVITQQA